MIAVENLSVIGKGVADIVREEPQVALETVVKRLSNEHMKVLHQDTNFAHLSGAIGLVLALRIVVLASQASNASEQLSSMVSQIEHFGPPEVFQVDGAWGNRNRKEPELEQPKVRNLTLSEMRELSKH